MATRGVFQLQKVKVMYCDCGGSSRGVRDFIREKIVDFAKKAPSVEIVTGLRRGHHPYIEGQYLDGTRKIITVKNLAPRDIMNYAEMLRNSSSGKVSKLGKPVRSSYKSIQGVWDNTFPLHTIPFKIEHVG